MLQKDYITNILGIANVSADKIERNREGVHIYISTKQSLHPCLCCGQKTKHIHDYRTQKIKDLNLYGEHCYLMLRKRRYVCGNCGKRFYEKYDSLPITDHIIVRRVVWAMENVRKGAQKAFFSNKRLHFKQNKYILLAPRETLGIEDGIVLEYMLKQNSDLYNAWQLKEMFYKFKDSASYDEAGEDKGV